MLKLINLRTGFALVASLLLILIAQYAFEPPAPGHHPQFYALLMREVGFALLVAILIWTVFEFFSAEEMEQKWNHRVETMTKNVFFGVLGKNLPRDLVEEAHTLLLDQTFIRSGFHVNYVLTDDTYKRPDGTDAPYLKLEAVVRYKVLNITGAPAELPVQIGLPNPLVQALKEKCGVDKLTIKQNGKSENIDLAIGEAAFRASLQDQSAHHATFKGPTITIMPNQKVPTEIVWHYVMAKEEEDNELGTTFLPMDSLSITIVDRNPGKRTVKARAIHPTDLEDDTSAASQGTYNFRLNRYVLPHQGFVVWWKKLTP
jgi:hypothetical protein